MSTADGTVVPGAGTSPAAVSNPLAATGAGRPATAAGPAQPAVPATAPVIDAIDADETRGDEHFIPVTRYALADRLSQPGAWPPGVAVEARRFFRYLDYWRQQRHATALMRLLQAYEPFSPDSDLFVTRKYTDEERALLQADVVAGAERLLKQANYVGIRRNDIERMILTKESHYGLDLKVDFQVFEEIQVHYRGASVKKEVRRKLSRFFRKQEFDVPIFRRVCVLFKVKSEARHIEDVMRDLELSREEAARMVRRARKAIPPQISVDSIYLKLFKNIPRSDVEMIFPNTQVKFRTHDKVWLGLSGGGAVGAGLFGAAGKLALLFSSPVTAVGAVGGIGMVLFRQVMNVMNQKQRYMIIMARNLYFHAMADNRGVMIKLADRAAEEDFKEEILLYSVLAKEQVKTSDLKLVDEAIERYLERVFGLQIDFDVADAYERLLRDGIVTEAPDGAITALPPAQAAAHIDAMWDQVLDLLPDMEPEVGVEIDREQIMPSTGSATVSPAPRDDMTE